jgi:hypothetical protein
MKDNFANSWALAGYKAMSPGSWVELGISALWGAALSGLGPLGWIIGFSLPMANTIAGWGAIEFFGGKVTPHKTLKHSMSISIQLNDLGNWGAFTLGNVIIGDTMLDATHLPHERGHVLQSWLLGPNYWWLIAIPSFLHALWYNATGKSQGVNYYDFYTEAWAEQWKVK